MAAAVPLQHQICQLSFGRLWQVLCAATMLLLQRGRVLLERSIRCLQARLMLRQVNRSLGSLQL